MKSKFKTSKFFGLFSVIISKGQRLIIKIQQVVSLLRVGSTIHNYTTSRRSTKSRFNNTNTTSRSSPKSRFNKTHRNNTNNTNSLLINHLKPLLYQLLQHAILMSSLILLSLCPITFPYFLNLVSSPSVTSAE